MMTPESLKAYDVLDGINVVVIIPAYNEERFIGSVVLRVKKYVETVIVIDDGSTDQTAEIATEAGAFVVQHAENQGKGTAVNSGLQKALEFSPDVVVMIDADGQHIPSELPDVVGPIVQGEADIVVGSRYLENRSEVPKHRIWGHRVFNFLTRAASGTHVSDSQSGFRAFSPKALNTISFNSNGFSVESEMQFMAKEYDLKVKEVPITIQYTDPPKRSVLKHGLSVFNGILRLVGQYRPLLFFGLPGFLIMIFGFGWGIWVVDIYRRYRSLAVGYAMISVLLVVVGMVGVSTGIILHSLRSLVADILKDKGG
jgi:glycosyltransferase involved in cell wall biosynthesis